MPTIALVADCDELADHARHRIEQSIDDLIRQGESGGLLPDNASARAARRDRLRSPARVLQYFDLGLCLLEDDAAGARRAFEDLISTTRWDRDAPVQPFDPDIMGRDCDRLAALTFGDRHARLQLGAPDDADLSRLRSQHDDVLSVLHDLVPEIVREYDALVDVVVIAPPGAPEVDSYGSATTLAALGLVLVNPVSALAFVDHVGTYVHELTHMVLHALTIDCRLTANDESERFSSPLRTDPRPMEGVVHAAIVCARMAAVFRRLGATDDPRRADCVDKAAELERRYHDSAVLIDRDALLTTRGREIWNRTRQIAAMSDPLSFTESG